MLRERSLRRGKISLIEQTFCDYYKAGVYQTALFFLSFFFFLIFCRFIYFTYCVTRAKQADTYKNKFGHRYLLDIGESARKVIFFFLETNE